MECTLVNMVIGIIKKKKCFNDTIYEKQRNPLKTLLMVDMKSWNHSLHVPPSLNHSGIYILVDLSFKRKKNHIHTELR